jgi:hypothetical protein
MKVTALWADELVTTGVYEQAVVGIWILSRVINEIRPQGNELAPRIDLTDFVRGHAGDFDVRGVQHNQGAVRARPPPRLEIV